MFRLLDYEDAKLHTIEMRALKAISTAGVDTLFGKIKKFFISDRSSEKIKSQDEYDWFI